MYGAERIITLPTLLTLIRIGLTPFIVMGIQHHHGVQTLLLFCAAAVTDLLDGILARWTNTETKVGACLDPLADKLLLIACFYALSSVVPQMMPRWFVVLVLVKEVVLVSSIGLLFALGTRVAIRPTWFGKVATLTQVGFVGLVLMAYFFAISLGAMHNYVLVMTTIVTLAALGSYALIGFKLFMQ